MKKWIALALFCALLAACCGSALAYTYAKDYFKDDYDPQIQQIQQQLIDLGYLSGGADGWFGNKTQAAIVRFQLVNGLEQTGTADQALQEALFADGAKPSPQILMTLDEMKKLMGTPTKIVKYDMSSMIVERDSATVELNNDVTLHADLLGDGVTEVQLVGKGNVKIPFTVLLMALDPSIDDAMMFEALDMMIEDGTRIVDGRAIEYRKDEDGTERLIVKPMESGTL